LLLPSRAGPSHFASRELYRGHGSRSHPKPSPDRASGKTSVSSPRRACRHDLPQHHGLPRPRRRGHVGGTSPERLITQEGEGDRFLGVGGMPNSSGMRRWAGARRARRCSTKTGLWAPPPPRISRRWTSWGASGVPEQMPSCSLEDYQVPCGIRRHGADTLTNAIKDIDQSTGIRRGEHNGRLPQPTHDV
jgi:hypothetical protein